jgi:release factor glutamine methyltransferase
VGTVIEVIRAARARLATVDPGGGDAELLLGAVLGVTRAQLHAAPESAVPDGAAERLERWLARRARGEPVAYLLGRKEFWSLELEVSDAVLVPRPETELVVEIGLSLISGWRSPRVADLGAGSGAIGLAIASERPDALVTLTEISAPALAVARGNADRLGLANVRCALGSWYRPLDARQDLIVSNPPYLTDAELSQAPPELSFEPRGALSAGVIGLEVIEPLIAQAADHLSPGASLVLEHGASQGAAVRAALGRAAFLEIATHRDLAGHERVTRGTRPS